MAQVNPYLNFNGNCREAMHYYKDCFGGELTLQTVGESPLAQQMPAQMSNAILHSMLRSGALTIMGSDMIQDSLANGNAYHLSLNCETKKEAGHLFTKLSAGGQVTSPLEPTAWGALFGSVIDKFGKSWFFYFAEN
jgi:PhnB protein